MVGQDLISNPVKRLNRFSVTCIYYIGTLCYILKELLVDYNFRTMQVECSRNTIILCTNITRWFGQVLSADMGTSCSLLHIPRYYLYNIIFRISSENDYRPSARLAADLTSVTHQSTAAPQVFSRINLPIKLVNYNALRRFRIHYIIIIRYLPLLYDPHFSTI